jgi:PAS domain S-box-containing protein
VQGHWIDHGRNVIEAERGLKGGDIFFAAVQMSRMPMCLTDPHRPDNPIIFCNRAFEALTGYTGSEILGRNCRFLQGPGTDRAAVDRIRAKLAAAEDVHEDLLNYRKDGSSYWNALFISPVVDPKGELLYFFASQLDVTARREAEAVVQQSQRMETLGSMAAGMAHEYNNLMTIVLAALERARGEARPERLTKQIERAEWGAKRAARLTDQMLSFSRRQFHDAQSTDLNALLAGIDTIIEQFARGRCTLAIEPGPGPITVAVDAGQFEIALMNLVRNASDAMPEGGTITIRTEAAGKVASISVRDEGVGMDADALRRSTEPFYTTKPLGQGTGLGLSMVRGFAEQSGGRLDIQSEPGRGTTARIELPRRG